jgi:hypothetical protein
VNLLEDVIDRVEYKSWQCSQPGLHAKEATAKKIEGEPTAFPLNGE